MFDSSVYGAVVPSGCRNGAKNFIAFLRFMNHLVGFCGRDKNWRLDGAPMRGRTACVIPHRFPGGSGSVQAIADLRAEPRLARRFSRCSSAQQAGERVAAGKPKRNA